MEISKRKKGFVCFFTRHFSEEREVKRKGLLQGRWILIDREMGKKGWVSKGKVEEFGDLSYRSRLLKSFSYYCNFRVKNGFASFFKKSF